MAGTVEVLVDSFQLSGTPFNVGHPRGESVGLMDAARRAGMRFIFMKQATAAAMLAATLGRTHRFSRRRPAGRAPPTWSTASRTPGNDRFPPGHP